MCAIMREKDGFGKSNRDTPFYVLFNACWRRDAARRAYGSHGLNCGEDNNFARECPSKFINDSGLINLAVGDGTPDEAEKLWHR